MRAEQIQLSIAKHKLAKLIHDKQLCAADFTCLDRQSKQEVWQLCLQCCQTQLKCGNCKYRDCQRIDLNANADK